MLNLDATLIVARSLKVPGKQASVKFACWSAVLSPQKRLSWNCLQAQALLPYVDRPLPQSPERVLAILRAGHPFCTRKLAEYVLAIEAAERRGELDELAVMPTTRAGWLVWRQAVKRLPGMGWKTASFAALLLWPDTCPLIPVDTHVCNRLGLSALKGKLGNYKVYRYIERLVWREWFTSGRRHECSPAEWHWYKWSEWRQATGDEPVSDWPESHAGLSPYVLDAKLAA